MNETAWLVLGAAITGLFGLLGAAIAVTVQVINARSAAKTAERTGAMAMDAAAFTRVTETQKIMSEAQAMMQAQANTQDATIRGLQRELSEIKAKLVDAISKLEAAEKASDPLHTEIAKLKAEIDGLKTLVAQLQAVIEELKAQIAASGPKV